MVGMDEQKFKVSSLSTIQEYKPYGILWYITDQTSVIYRVTDSATQGILLQFSGLNWVSMFLMFLISLVKQELGAPQTE